MYYCLTMCVSCTHLETHATTHSPCKHEASMFCSPLLVHVMIITALEWFGVVVRVSKTRCLFVIVLASAECFLLLACKAKLAH